MNIRGLKFLCGLSLLAAAAFAVFGCGNSYYYAGRSLPPSGIANRALVAIQNTSITGTGSLEIEDAYYDIRHSYNNTVPSYFISGYAGKGPTTIQNMPAEQFGAVYGAEDGSLALIDYATEKESATVSGLSGLSSSIFISNTQQYVIAAQPTLSAVQFLDRVAGTSYSLNLPNASMVSLNPAATVALVFVQDSNNVYSLLRLQNNAPAPSNAEDCEPKSVPFYCLMPVAGKFDRPYKAVYSADGTTAYILNCGPECGGTQASVSLLPTAGVLVQSGSPVPPGAPTQVTATIPVPGGATDALNSGNALYLAGQQMQSNGLWAGMLTVLNTTNNTITTTTPISDGTHDKMVLGDDNSLWVGSSLCSEGERYYESQQGVNEQFGCVTMFNTSTNTVTMVDSYQGNATGIAAITSLGKVYTTEGGQVYIYSTTDGAQLDNANVTVVGTAADVAYIDAPSDTDNTYY